MATRKRTSASAAESTAADAAESTQTTEDGAADEAVVEAIQPTTSDDAEVKAVQPAETASETKAVQPPKADEQTGGTLTVRVDPSTWKYNEIMSAGHVWTRTPQQITANDPRLAELRACPHLLIT